MFESHSAGFPSPHCGHIGYYRKAQHFRSLNLLVEFLNNFGCACASTIIFAPLESLINILSNDRNNSIFIDVWLILLEQVTIFYEFDCISFFTFPVSLNYSETMIWPEVKCCPAQSGCLREYLQGCKLFWLQKVFSLLQHMCTISQWCSDLRSLTLEGKWKQVHVALN